MLFISSIVLVVSFVLLFLMDQFGEKFWADNVVTRWRARLFGFMTLMSLVTVGLGIWHLVEKLL